MGPEGEAFSLLVVEDQALISLHIEQAIRELGAASVGCASTVTAALALIEKTSWSAALLDLRSANGEMVYPVAVTHAGKFDDPPHQVRNTHLRRYWSFGIKLICAPDEGAGADLVCHPGPRMPSALCTGHDWLASTRQGVPNAPGHCGFEGTVYLTPFPREFAARHIHELIQHLNADHSTCDQQSFRAIATRII